MPNDSPQIEPYFRALAGCEGILHAIDSEPDDDAPRLVLADWLEEHGEPERAEYVRLQCRLADVPDWLAWMLPDEPLRHSLRLLTAHRRRWAKGVAWAEFARGMAEGLVLSGQRDGWVGLLARARKKHPIRRLRTQLRRADWDVFAREALASLPLSELDLGVDGPLGAEEMSTLVNAPCFGSLRVLTLRCPSLATPAMSVLALAAAPRLRGLSLRSGVGDEGVAVLARACGFPRLRQLCLSYNGMGLEGALALAAQPLCAEVTHLDLSHNSVGATGLAALASPGLLGRVRALNLRQNHIGYEGATILARSRLLGRLLHLNLADNAIGEGVAELSRSPQAAGLQTLDLSSNATGPAGLEGLTGSPTWTRLMTLELGYNDLSDAALRALVKGLGRIERLGLSGGWIGPEGLAALISSNNLAGLKRLELQGNPLGCEGARVIAGCAALGEMTHLDLCGCEIDAGGMLALASSPHLRQLSCLDLRHNRGIKAARAALVARFFPAPF